MNARAESHAPVDRRALVILALAGAAACVLCALLDPSHFLHSYLVAYLFWTGLTVGSLGLLLLQHSAGGAWGVLLLRFLESGAGTIPLMVVAFLPIAFGLPSLYVWARPEAVQADPLLQWKHAYLNVPFFLIRTAVFFLLWAGALALVLRWSRDRERTGDEALSLKLRHLSAPGMIVIALTFTFAVFDWGMSLEPSWYSTIYGLMVLVGDVLGSVCLVVIFLAFFARRPPLSRHLTRGLTNDVGNIMLMFLMLWGYLSFSQWLLIWYGNLPEEAQWYARRAHGVWRFLLLAVVLANFFLPFLLLLWRAVKRDLRRLALVAAIVFVTRFALELWLILPAFAPQGLRLTDLAVPVGLGGIWVALFLWRLAREPIVRRRDPRLLLPAEEAA